MDESAGTQPTVGGRVFGALDPMAYAPPATNAITGLLGDYGTMATEEFDSPTAGTNFMGPLTDPSYGDVTSQVDTFRGVPMSQPGTDFFGGDVTAPATPAPVVQAMQAGPAAPNVAPVDNFAQVQAQALAEQQRANEFASAQQAQAQAQAQQQAYDQNVAAQAQAQAQQAQQALAQQQAYDQDVARLSNLRGRDRGVDPREVAELEARIGAYRGDPVGRASAIGRDERNGGGYSESGMGQQGGRGHPGMR